MIGLDEPVTLNSNGSTAIVELSGVDEAKRRAAEGALKLIGDAKLIGLGTGSTVEKLIGLLDPNADSVYVASSIDTAVKASSRGLKVLHPSSIRGPLDIYIDGADEVDEELNMIKGGGAALTMEKILAHHSMKRIFMVDHTKLVSRLGENRPVPVEVIRDALMLVTSRLDDMGYDVVVRRPGSGKYGPILSDTCGVIIDVRMPGDKGPEYVENELKSVPGVVETGLFLGLVDVVTVGYTNKTRVIARGSRSMDLHRQR